MPFSLIFELWEKTQGPEGKPTKQREEHTNFTYIDLRWELKPHDCITVINNLHCTGSTVDSGQQMVYMAYRSGIKASLQNFSEGPREDRTVDFFIGC